MSASPEGTPIPQHVVYVLDVAEKPGILHAIAAVFAHRGLSIRALVADASRSSPRILVGFHGTARQCRMVEQVLPRLHDVHRVRVLAGDAPELYEAAVCRVSGRVPAFPGVSAQTLGEGVLLTGRYAAIEAAVEQLEEAGILGDVFRTLMAD